jgi:hypothetical protein
VQATGLPARARERREHSLVAQAARVQHGAPAPGARACERARERGQCIVRHAQDRERGAFERRGRVGAGAGAHALCERARRGRPPRGDHDARAAVEQGRSERAGEPARTQQGHHLSAQDRRRFSLPHSPRS